MASKQIPGSDLTRVPRLTFAFVENFVQANSRSAGTSQLNKGFKYYSEGFISSLKASCDDNCCRLTARCYRSQRKNESPHDIQIILHSEPVSVSSASCSCAIGLSQCCGHITGTLYLVAHYKLCGVRSIPQDVAKTSLPQTWHIPRGDKIRGMSVQEVEVVGYKRDSDEQHKPVKSTLYNPIRSPLPPFELLFDKLSVSHPDSSLLTTVPPTGESYPPLVNTRFGLFHKGSSISHQQKLSPSYLLNIVDAFYPDLPVNSDNTGDNHYSHVTNESQTTLLDSLLISREEAVEIEKATRLQAADKKWKRLRTHRVTASKVGEISKRKKDPENYAQKLRTSTRSVMTEAMREGLANEPVAVAAYSRVKDDKINIYPSGIVINPKCSWMAASPDRKVLDPSTIPPFGLLEIKCPDLSNKDIQDLQYLTMVNGNLCLKKNDNYYHQIQMQLAMSGLVWCDFFVWSTKATHLERIYFCRDSWQQTKDKADKFYFDYILC